MNNHSLKIKLAGISLLALALGIGTANAGNQCQSQWNDALAAESYADSVCSAGGEGCDSARAQAEISFRDYAECMAFDSNGPL